MFQLNVFKNGSVELFWAFSESKEAFEKDVLSLRELLVQFTVIPCIGVDEKRK